MKELAIVAIGYNRPHSLARLLRSLRTAHYSSATSQVPLVISLDNCGSREVLDVARAFDWPYGPVELRTFPVRLGLRNHVLACGDLTERFANIAVFEDDIVVSPQFFDFAVRASNYYESDDSIAGISLYSHQWHIGCNRPFAPALDGFDAFFLRFPSSWGQVWSQRQWSRFREWYSRSDDNFTSPSVPPYVASWPASSWLKYHIRYCIETERDFVYPRWSLTTNCGDKGQHVLAQNSGYQVPLLQTNAPEWRLPIHSSQGVSYDAYFERIGLAKGLGLAESELCVDLFAMKQNRSGTHYWLTTSPGGFQIKASFGLALRPHESNVEFGFPGSDIYLYDTRQPARTPSQLSTRRAELCVAQYDLRNTPRSRLLGLALASYWNSLTRRLLRTAPSAVK